MPNTAKQNHPIPDLSRPHAAYAAARASVDALVLCSWCLPEPTYPYRAMPSLSGPRRAYPGRATPHLMPLTQQRELPKQLPCCASRYTPDLSRSQQTRPFRGAPCPTPCRNYPAVGEPEDAPMLRIAIPYSAIKVGCANSNTEAAKLILVITQMVVKGIP